MKTLFISIGLVAVLFLSTTSVEAQKRKSANKANKSVAIAQAGKCSAVVRDDLLPNRGVVVVGCDSFGNNPQAYLADGPQSLPSNGGIVVFDFEMNIIFRWEACVACGGFFSSFAGTKKVKGHNALLVKLVGGPRRDDGKPTPPLVLPLYFNGREFKLDRYSTNNALPETNP